MSELATAPGSAELVSETGQPFAIGRQKSLLRRAWRQWRTRIGVAMTAAILVVVLAGPAMAPYSPSALVGAPFELPSSRFLFGTDYLGRDVLSRVLNGGLTVVGLSIAATIIGLVLGATVGMLAGYAGGRIDEVLMRLVDVVLAFPPIVLAILFVSMLGPKLWLIALLVGIAHSPSVARLSRGVTLDVAQRDFVRAGEAIGLPRRKLLFNEILPNLTTPLMVDAGVRLTWSVATIAALSFLGFGLQPPSSDWGLMINENRNGLAIQPWSMLVPVMAICVLTIGTNLIAEGVARTAAGIDRRRHR